MNTNTMIVKVGLTRENAITVEITSELAMTCEIMWPIHVMGDSRSNLLQPPVATKLTVHPEVTSREAAFL